MLSIRYKKYRVRCSRCWNIPRRGLKPTWKCLRCGKIFWIQPDDTRQWKFFSLEMEPFLFYIWIDWYWVSISYRSPPDWKEILSSVSVERLMKKRIDEMNLNSLNSYLIVLLTFYFLSSILNLFDTVKKVFKQNASD